MKKASKTTEIKVEIIKRMKIQRSIRIGRERGIASECLGKPQVDFVTAKLPVRQFCDGLPCELKYFIVNQHAKI